MVTATRIHLVLGDQLSHSLSALADADPETSLVLMAEVTSEASYVKHHKKKIAFLFSAMRHFAEELREKGLRVRYVTLDEPENTQSLKGELDRALAESGASAVITTECGEWRLAEEMRGWETDLVVQVEIREDDRFLCSIEDFRTWRSGRKQLRMEYFYRDMRRRHRVLLEGEEPVGGKWNFDAENRKPASPDLLGLTDELLAHFAAWTNTKDFHDGFTRHGWLEVSDTIFFLEFNQLLLHNFIVGEVSFHLGFVF